MPRLAAQRAMRNLKYSDVRLSVDQLYDLVFDLTDGDGYQASTAAGQLAWAQERAKSFSDRGVAQNGMAQHTGG